jgi:hypothetical protein
MTSTYATATTDLFAYYSARGAYAAAYAAHPLLLHSLAPGFGSLADRVSFPVRTAPRGHATYSPTRSRVAYWDGRRYEVLASHTPVTTYAGGQMFTTQGRQVLTMVGMESLTEEKIRKGELTWDDVSDPYPAWYGWIQDRPAVRAVLPWDYYTSRWPVPRTVHIPGPPRVRL